MAAWFRCKLKKDMRSGVNLSGLPTGLVFEFGVCTVKITTNVLHVLFFWIDSESSDPSAILNQFLDKLTFALPKKHRFVLQILLI